MFDYFLFESINKYEAVFKNRGVNYFYGNTLLYFYSKVVQNLPDLGDLDRSSDPILNIEFQPILVKYQ